MEATFRTLELSIIYRVELFIRSLQMNNLHLIGTHQDNPSGYWFCICPCEFNAIPIGSRTLAKSKCSFPRLGMKCLVTKKLKHIGRVPTMCMFFVGSVPINKHSIIHNLFPDFVIAYIRCKKWKALFVYVLNI